METEKTACRHDSSSGLGSVREKSIPPGGAAPLSRPGRDGLVAAAVLLAFLGLCATVFAELDPESPYLFPGGDARLADPARIPEIVRQSRDLARAWFVKQVLPDGLFLYLYDPASGRFPAGQSSLRQFMATRLLGEMAAKDPSLRTLHRLNLDAELTRWYRKDGYGLGFILEGGESELGGNAMALRSLVASPFFADYSATARSLADGILETQNADGSFDPYFVFPRYSFDWPYSMAFYSGEATLALVEYYEKVGEKEYLDAAVKAQDFYVGLYVPPVLPNYYPACVPWQTLALCRLYRITGNERYAAAVFTLNEKLIEIEETGKNPGRFFNPDLERYGGTHSSSDGVFTESLAWALELARLKKDAAREKLFRRAIALSVGNLVSLQYDKEPFRLAPGQRSVVGAFRVRDNDGHIRIDSVQHIIDAYDKILAVW